MLGLGKGGGGGGGHHGGGGGHHGGGGGHHGGGGGHHGGGHRGGFRGGRGIFTGGSPAYFAPGWGYPYWDDSYPLQVVVPENCEESVRSGCYQRWGHDAAKMATCVADGYKGCGLKGLGAFTDRTVPAALALGALGAAVGYFMKKKTSAVLIGAAVGAAVPLVAAMATGTPATR